MKCIFLDSRIHRYILKFYEYISLDVPVLVQNLILLFFHHAAADLGV